MKQQRIGTTRLEIYIKPSSFRFLLGCILDTIEGCLWSFGSYILTFLIYQTFQLQISILYIKLISCIKPSSFRFQLSYILDTIEGCLLSLGSYIFIFLIYLFTFFFYKQGAVFIECLICCSLDFSWKYEIMTSKKESQGDKKKFHVSPQSPWPKRKQISSVASVEILKPQSCFPPPPPVVTKAHTAPLPYTPRHTHAAPALTPFSTPSDRHAVLHIHTLPTLPRTLPACTPQRNSYVQSSWLMCSASPVPGTQPLPAPCPVSGS